MDDIERYNDLRQATAPLPKFLTVLFLPEDPVSWLVHSETELVTKRCAYWVSLLDAPASKNKSGQTVYLPQRNVLSVEGLRSLAERLSREEKITYVQ